VSVPILSLRNQSNSDFRTFQGFPAFGAFHSLEIDMLEASKPADPKAITSLQSGENGIWFGIKIFYCLYVRIDFN
jgi:hypothetical protein